MALKDELETFVTDTFKKAWERRDGQVVPELDKLTLGNTAVNLDATILYADLADSTGLVASSTDYVAAEIYKTYLYCAAKIIIARGGVIRAYDGDRVMGVFIGSSQNTSAVKAALQINWAVNEIVKPKFKAMYTSSTYELTQRVGIDRSAVMVARTGVRGSNDLVWVGTAANNAAKMAALKLGYKSYITATVYDRIHESAKYGAPKDENMWTDLGSTDLGYQVLGSGWQWSL